MFMRLSTVLYMVKFLKNAKSQRKAQAIVTPVTFIRPASH